MAFKMTIEENKTLNLPGEYDQVFDELADTVKMAQMLPGLDQIVDQGDDVFRWEMEKTGFGKYAFQLVYAVKYTIEKDKGTISWVPIKGVGNGVNQGKTTVTATDDGVKVNLYSKIEVEFPFPKLAKALIKPLVMREFKSTTEQFEANIKKHFGV